MAINVVRYRSGLESRWGVNTSQGVLAVGQFHSTSDFLQHGVAPARELWSAFSAGSAALDFEQVEPQRVCSPITKPCRVVCQAMNYRQHLRDGGLDPDGPGFNVFFTKSSASVSEPNGAILRPQHVELLDYELEVGVVIGKPITRATRITPGNLHQYVAGLVMANDVTARDVQLPQGQYFKGKSYRTFCPLGPHLCLLEAEDFAQLDDIDLQLSVNDVVRQRGNTRDLIYKPAATLSELSEFCDLDPGDVVLTGTPGGCAVRPPRSKALLLLGRLLPEPRKWQLFVENQRKNRNYLQPGDQLRSWIRSQDGSIDLGVQENRVLQASPTAEGAE